MDDDIFAQFEGPKPPPLNPSDGEPKPNGRKKVKAKGKRGRPKKAAPVIAEAPAKARAPRKAREIKISLTAAAEVFTGLTNADVAFVTAAIRNMSGMSAKQKQRIARTLNMLFA
jgi:hypothetical protein